MSLATLAARWQAVAGKCEACGYHVATNKTANIKLQGPAFGNEW